MLNKMLLLPLLFVDLFASSFTPKLNIDLSINPLFPANQKMYNAKKFKNEDDGSMTPVDTLVPISDYVNWMYGYSIGGKFGKLSFLNLGITVKFEHLFKMYFDRYWDEAEAVLDSTPIDLNLLVFQGGLFSSFRIAERFTIEPEIRFLYVNSHSVYYLRNLPKFICSIGKIGLFTGLRLLFDKFEKIGFGADLAFLTYGEINELTVNPFVQIRLMEWLKVSSGVNYSFFTNAVKPHLGIDLSFF